MPRVGVIHEIVFDTGFINSLDVIASGLKNDLWRQRAANIRILIEAPNEGKNINIELRPTFLQHSGREEPPIAPDDAKYGVIVNVDINNQQMPADLTKAQISDILAFANDYIPEELLKFLNNEE